MIKIHKNIQGTEFMIIQNNSGLLANETYFVGMNVCQDVQCNCGAGNLLINTDENFNDNTLEGVIPVSIHSQSINSDAETDLYSKTHNKHKIRDYFIDNLTKDDWHKLNLRYAREKFDTIESADLDDITFKFTQEEIENENLSFPYADIFEASFFQVETDKGVYSIYDMYCKKPACNCNDILLKVFKLKDASEQATSDGLVADISLNYKTFKADIKSNDILETKKVLSMISSDYPEIESILTQRNKFVRNLYQKTGIIHWQN